MTKNINSGISLCHFIKTNVTLLIASALIFVAFISWSHLSVRFSSPETYSHQIERLDEKKETVMRLTVASATASAVITMIPDDTCTPIAEQLADISKDFGIILAAILLEKYLLTTLGFAFYGVVAPVCLTIIAAAMFMPRDSRVRNTMLTSAFELLVVGVILWGSIPAGVFVTDGIEETYGASIAAAIDSAERSAEVSSELDAGENPESKAWYEYAGEFLRDPASAFGSAADRIGEFVEWAQTVLGSFVESIAVMAVTSCVIPILIPALMLWAVKLLLPLSCFGGQARSLSGGSNVDV